MNGLSSKEVLKSRELHGSNKLPEPKLDKWYDFAKEALSEKITMILIAIAVLQLFLGVMGVMDLSDPIMILVVLAIVTCIAVKTGLGVQKSAAELRAKTSVRYCDVIRDGKVQTINKDELVVGDLVCVGMGQEIFADGYLMEIVRNIIEREYEFKCLNNYTLPFVLRKFNREEITENDKVFYHEGLLSKFMEVPNMEVKLNENK